MSVVNVPIIQPGAHALIIGAQESRNQPQLVLEHHGFDCAFADDPYAGMAELSRKSAVIRAVAICLNGLYREELMLVSVIKHRWPHIEVFLAHVDGRQSAMSEALQLGADGLLTDGELQRLAPARSNDRSKLMAANSQFGRPEPVQETGGDNGSGSRRRPSVLQTSTRIPGANDGPRVPAIPGPSTDRPPLAEVGLTDVDEHCELDTLGSDRDPVLTASELRALLHDPQQQPPNQGH